MQAYRTKSLQGPSADLVSRALPISRAYLMRQGFISLLSTRKDGSSNLSPSKRTREKTAGDADTRGTSTSVQGRSSGGATGGRCSKARRRSIPSTVTVSTVTGVAFERKSN